MPDKIKFAVIGAGHIGKRHATMAQRYPEGELVAMVDTDPARRAEVEAFGVPFFESTEKFFAEGPKADVICVCTPNGYHAEQAIMALENSCHVVCEKPMALSKADCERIIYKSLQTSKLVFCVMQNRYSPPSLWLKEMISENRLGQIFMVQINCYWNRDERYYKAGTWKGDQKLDGGTLFTQFSHFIDIMYWLFGDIKNISGRFMDYTHQTLTDFEDSGLIQFEFMNGGNGCLNYSTAVWDTNLESSITIIGEKGSIKVGGQYMNEVEYCHVQDYEMPELAPSNPANDYGHYKGSAANHHYIFENVIDTLKGKSFATTNALEGLKVVEIIERIYSLREQLKTRN
ncbi:Gfo/Idh/MocA family protein [Rufibacter roseus]|uniref:Gfo/Idh/MocA family protein n=1 Tax=Rufibacter roseus TaxID=1567108 RepID=A0ABW2DNP0_9BACT|nr:Gfo/Idh/MocA family oxidoreductase [Rufibacter roseus]